MNNPQTATLLPQVGPVQLLLPQKIREAKYEVLLFFVELLMEYKSRKLHDLSCLFGSPNFSSEMKQVVGGSQTGLKRFLLKHPSLFTIKGDTVTMTCYDVDDLLFRNGHGGANNGFAVREAVPRMAASPEDEAVEFFKTKLLAAPVKDEFRLPLRSLVGHRSQAPEKIRYVMGRNLPDFIRFLRAHSDTFMYDAVTDTVKLTPTAQKLSPRDCPSPVSSVSSQSLPSGEFDANECLEFLGVILQQKGPLFLDELYGHMNKKYKPDVRQHFAKNPRELGDMIQQKGTNRFRVEGNIVTYNGPSSPQDQPGAVRSPPGSAREGMKLRLAQTLKQVMTENKARGALPEPEVDRTSPPPWVEIIKPKQLKALVSEILDSSAGAEAVGLSFVCVANSMADSSSAAAVADSVLDYKLSKMFLATFDGKIHLISVLEHPELMRLGGLKELLTSDKIRKVFHDGSKGLAALVSQYGLRMINPFDTQVGHAILEYQNNVTINGVDQFLDFNRSASAIDVASGCAPAALRRMSLPNKVDPTEMGLYEAFNNLRIVFPHVYEALKSRMSVKYTPLMRTLLEEQYEEYLNPERAILLRKNRKTLHQLDILQAKLNHVSTGSTENNTASLNEEESRLKDMVHTDADSFTSFSEANHYKANGIDIATQTVITGDIFESLEIYDKILKLHQADTKPESQ